MESLTDTEWDVLISGTGLSQSLLALALSRSGKKVLHVDKNPYYGGPEAAFSLQEAEEWVDRLKKEPGQEPFEEVSIYSRPVAPDTENKLSFSRAYTLSLSPYLIYSRSKLLPTLVSSKVYRQLEFQAVGSWWIYRCATAGEDTTPQSNEGVPACLNRVPSSREDIFADESISVKAKRMLIKFLRNVSQPPQEGSDGDSVNEDDLDLPFTEFLTSRFQVPSELHDPLLSLSLSQSSPQQTSARFAVPRIKRHLGSIGVFGPGFGSLLAKWGGGSEIAQVGCRALAVGGGVYVLNRSIQSVEAVNDDETFLRLKLSDGESVRSRFVVGSQWDLPLEAEGSAPVYAKAARCIAVVSSSLQTLFPVTAEGGPIPAGTVVVFPGKELSGEQRAGDPPVYLLVHSSDTGESPEGQCVVYGSVSIPGDEGQSLLDAAISKLLQTFAGPGNEPELLWALRYTQLGLPSGKDDLPASIRKSAKSDRIVYLPPPSLDISFDDSMIDAVKAVWKMVMGDEARDEDFMTFEDRDAGLDE